MLSFSQSSTHDIPAYITPEVIKNIFSPLNTVSHNVISIGTGLHIQQNNLKDIQKYQTRLTYASEEDVQIFFDILHSMLNQYNSDPNALFINIQSKDIRFIKDNLNILSEIESVLLNNELKNHLKPNATNFTLHACKQALQNPYVDQPHKIPPMVKQVEQIHDLRQNLDQLYNQILSPKPNTRCGPGLPHQRR
jgi:hypothetical protein